MLGPLHACVIYSTREGLYSRVLAHVSTHTSTSAWTTHEGQEPPLTVLVQANIPGLHSTCNLQQEQTCTLNKADLKATYSLYTNSAMRLTERKDRARAKTSSDLTWPFSCPIPCLSLGLARCRVQIAVYCCSLQA